MYPSGICLKTEKAMYLLHRDGKLHKIVSEEIYKSWNFPLTVETTEIAVSRYPVSLAKLLFRDGSLIYNIKDARIYLVSNGERRQVVSPAALKRLGVNINDAMVVSDSDVNLMKLGEEIS